MISELFPLCFKVTPEHLTGVGEPGIEGGLKLEVRVVFYIEWG